MWKLAAAAAVVVAAVAAAAAATAEEDDKDKYDPKTRVSTKAIITAHKCSPFCRCAPAKYYNFYYICSLMHSLKRRAGAIISLSELFYALKQQRVTA